MTPLEGSPPPSGGAGAGDGGGARLSARDFLGPVLLSHIERVRADARRVVTGSEQGAEPDAEAVHDFRVSLRRLRTLLKPARRIYGRRRLRPVAEGLREFARATGALRDEEVLRETLTALDLDEAARAAVAGWVAQRARREREARAHIVELLQQDRPDDTGVAQADAPAEGDTGATQTYAPAEGERLRLEPHLARLERRISRRKARKRGAEALARRAIGDALDDVRTLAASDPGDGAAMHALRIRFKRLRYSAETFSPLFGERAERTAKSASRMQRRLGQLHDADEALAQMTRAEALAPDARAAVIEALAAERARLAHKATEELARELDALTSLWSGDPRALPSG
ncbi:CHAD domain-containing protein [Sorangium atrum]|uniref:CHAD domain-containing protein n=1 Tax=Sorangium atrum TaxID=2995308 RepID=A0ABT5C5K9_9BACT|nr:CHAD domain-containing protein [Sorangium aterium]MDC0680452.1 CHAD domain-containing protein [Sorangium aterium]